ncbi:MAG: 5-dehydro-4-deoxyglucarate dehydratase [Actinophytocola sp.]|nr:5-dehydro-4-deoxyglucarate dehydratase [Actinophytocola sp.]
MDLSGVLFFPVTPFEPAGVDVGALTSHLEHGLGFGPGGVFVACGTGEFPALALREHADAVRTAVGVTGGMVPVVAGAGGPLPHAVDCARQAADIGADGLLVMPPYLAAGPQHGLRAYVDELLRASPLPVILYQRGTARFSPESAAELACHPRVVGFKDGTGDLDLLHRIMLAVRADAGEDFPFFNGLPTAEFSMPAYRGLGITQYSSAAFAFVPEVATAFHDAVAEGETALVSRLLTEFYRPLVELRDSVPGYAVSLVKAGARLRGQAVGSVRPPLADPDSEDIKRLERLIEQGLAAVDG